LVIMVYIINLLKKLLSKGRQKLIYSKRNLSVLVSYIIFFSIILMRTINGVGQYWDWSFPFFKDQIPNYFSKASVSWTIDAQGSPLSYSTDYFFRFVVSRFSFINPEHLLYGMLVIMLAFSAFGVYLITVKKSKNIIVSILIGLISILNPAIFYKLIAGHLDYLFSYCIFIWLIYFLFNVFRKKTKHYAILGIILALIGTQIQFFIMSAIVVVLFFIFHKNLISKKLINYPRSNWNKSSVDNGIFRWG
jgi:hypothetical protein